ncbi:MAG: hypothetical protein GY927_22485 [bacterium]|nr:hypothetical protein [bacterium]
MAKQNVVRLNTSGFPEELKHKIVAWGQSIVPQWTISQLIVVLCQEWEDDIAGFERRHQIRKKEESVIDDKEAKRQAWIADLKRQLAEAEGQA